MTIARRTALDVLRRENRPTRGAHEPEQDVVVHLPGIERAWETWEVKRALEQLPDEERQVVWLAHFHGMSHPQIANQLGMFRSVPSSHDRFEPTKATGIVTWSHHRPGRSSAMNAQDWWANYLDPDTHPDARSRVADDLTGSEVAALDRLSETLRDEAVWGEPGDDPRARLLDEAALHPRRSTLRSVDGGDRNRAQRRFPRLVTVGAGMMAAAAAIALVAVFAADRLVGESGDITTYEVAGTELTPDLDATVDIEPLSAGVAITLHIAGLPPAPEGRFYAGWLMPDMDSEMGSDTDDGEMTSESVDDDEAGMGFDSMAMMDTPMVGIGSFHWREGGIPIELWSGVDTDRYPILVVTLQDEDDPLTPSDQVVMTARVDGS